MKTTKIGNNYKVSGKKMTSRFGLSHSAERQAVKQGIMPGAAEVKAMGRDSIFTAKEWKRRQRLGLRRLRKLEMNDYMHDVCPN